MKETDKIVLFHRGWPSQWVTSYFKDYNGVVYNCCEQYMMAEKARVFGDDEALQRILSTNSPKEQQSIGREVKRFDIKVWELVCRDSVYRGNLFKFTQSKVESHNLVWGKNTFKELLMATGDKLIAEASPTDAIWGIRLAEDDPIALDPTQWEGKNLLGEALMKVRETIRLSQ